MYNKKISVFAWQDLVSRVTQLEEKVFGKKKPPITLNQQVLVLEHLGMLDKIRQLNISNIKKAQLLAIILKSDTSNTKKALEATPKKEGGLKTYYNYSFLSKLFEDFELPEIDKINRILNKLEKPE